jgi:hypothetical protein
MSNIPNVVLAESLIHSNQEMIPTSVVLAESYRAEADNNIQEFLRIAEVRTELTKRGLSSEEVTARLASLSEQERGQLSIQIKEARAGGDILITFLLIVLIIYFIKRI